MSVLDGLSHLQEALYPLLLMETLKKDWKFQGQNPCLKCWQPVQFCVHSRLSGSIQHLFPKMPNTEFFQHHALSLFKKVLISSMGFPVAQWQTIHLPI